MQRYHGIAYGISAGLVMLLLVIIPYLIYTLIMVDHADLVRDEAPIPLTVLSDHNTPEYEQPTDELTDLSLLLPEELALLGTESMLALGEQLFVTTCTGCHGVNGTGDFGPAINSQQFLSNRDDAALAQTIIFGGHRPNTAMPAFEQRFDEIELNALVSYIRSLEETAPQVADPRGSHHPGGGPPWLDPSDPDSAMSPGGGRGLGRGRGHSFQDTQATPRVAREP